MGKGTGSFGKRRNKTHTLCVSRRAAAAPADNPSGRIRKCNWSVKAIRRKTTGTGRMRYLRHVPRRFKSSFREGLKYMGKGCNNKQTLQLFLLKVELLIDSSGFTNPDRPSFQRLADATFGLTGPNVQKHRNRLRAPGPTAFSENERPDRDCTRATQSHRHRFALLDDI
ncbi:hypothetical protein MUK42_25701 [Musa troglodytarum]|uniref:Ribosomal protein L37 n=1 Tax=Musa troglodytarum TaxID=320322 RepID=A0A9E7IE81_9LILI|nr:hypothetical protein MUK42_25701 [Musa troglodytarum]